MMDEERQEKRRSSVSGLLTGDAVRRALVVSLVVGSILNFINQGEALLGRGDIAWTKLALTFAVPFFVSLHGAFSAMSR